MRINIAGVWMLLLALISAGCAGEARKSAVPPDGPVVVHTVAAAAEQWPSSYETVGTVRARTAAVISAKVMAYVREVRVQAGDRVHEGDLLASLDTRELESNYRRAEAGRDEAHSVLAETDQALAAAQVQLDLANVTFGRMQELFNKKSISDQEFDEATARRKTAAAAYQIAVSKNAQARARTIQAGQDLQAAAVVRGYAEIRAPFAGLVTARTIEPGSMAVPGTQLITLEREGAYRLEASVEESQLESIRAGQAVSVNLETLDARYTARVSEIVPAVDAASRSYLVKIDLPPVAQLRSGIFGRAAFSTGVRTVLAVPAAAVSERGQLQSVLVLEGGAAHTRLITSGRRSADRLEVLSGLTAGEAVICPLPPGLADGARVEARP